MWIIRTIMQHDFIFLDVEEEDRGYEIMFNNNSWRF